MCPRALDDLSERIRANATGAKGYNGVVNGVTVTGTGTSWRDLSTQVAAASTHNPDCSTAACTQAQRADYDLIQWRNLLRTTLPGGAGCISGDGVTDSTSPSCGSTRTLCRATISADTLRSNETCTSGDSDTGRSRASAAPPPPPRRPACAATTPR